MIPAWVIHSKITCTKVKVYIPRGGGGEGLAPSPEFDERKKKMRINFKKYVIAGLWAFAFSSILCVADSYAVFENLTSAGSEIFSGMRQVIWGAAGFGIIAIAIGAIFGGLNWKWLTAIIIGLVVIALTGGILSYLTAGTGADTSVSGIQNTLVTAE